MHRRIFLSITTLFLLALAQPASSGSQTIPGEPVRGEELTAYVMTMGSGAEVWERFGHNAIFIRDSFRGTEIAYNWGLFDFAQEDFILKFIEGKMDYWMEGIDAELTANHYVARDRSVWVQELNLTPAQRADLRDFLEWNALPENRVYRYDYYRDNCSTRVRDAIDRILGGQLRAQTENVPSGTTYREYTRAAMGDQPVLYTGIMLATGHPADRELSAWEEMFMPQALMKRVREVTVTGPTGAPIPLVATDQEFFTSVQYPEGAAQSPGIGFYLAIGLLLAAGVVVSVRLSQARRGARIAFRVVVIAWCLFAGIFGKVLAYLWLFTDHVATYGNENLFFFNPLLILLAVLLPFAVSSRERFRRGAFLVAGTVAGISALGFILNLLPWFYQENAEIIALALPVNLALAYAAWLLYAAAPRVAGSAAPTGAPGRVKPIPA